MSVLANDPDGDALLRVLERVNDALLTRPDVEELAHLVVEVKPPKDVQAAPVWPVWDRDHQERLLDYLRQPKRRFDPWSDDSQVYLDDEPCESDEDRAAREWADDCLKILRGQVPG